MKIAAQSKGITPTQLAIAWVVAKSARIIPVIGARTRTQLKESLDAIHVNLSQAEAKELEEAMPANQVAGARYAEQQMMHLDSER